MSEQKVQSWAEFFHETSQKARDALPNKIKEFVIVKCDDVAKTGLMTCDFTLKDLDIKTTDKVEQGTLLDAVCDLLKKDGFEVKKLSVGSWAAEWVGIWVSWAKAQPKVQLTSETPALKHEIEL